MPKAPLTKFRPEVENNDEMQQIEIEGADNTLILSYCRDMCSCLEWPRMAGCVSGSSVVLTGIAGTHTGSAV